MALTAIVLGSAAGGGFPQWNCRCPVCALAWAGDPRVTPRTQSSLAVTGDGAAWTLFNASPDLGAPIGAVVLTNADVDHIAGLLSLRERQCFRLFALEPVLAVLAENPVFAVLGP